MIKEKYYFDFDFVVAYTGSPIIRCLLPVHDVFHAWIPYLVYQLVTSWAVQGLDPNEGQDSPNLSRLALGPIPPPPVQCVLGVKRPGRGVDRLAPSSAEVKEGVELYLYSPSGTW